MMIGVWFTDHCGRHSEDKREKDNGLGLMEAGT